MVNFGWRRSYQGGALPLSYGSADRPYGPDNPTFQGFSARNPIGPFVRFDADFHGTARERAAISVKNRWSARTAPVLPSPFR